MFHIDDHFAEENPHINQTANRGAGGRNFDREARSHGVRRRDGEADQHHRQIGLFIQLAWLFRLHTCATEGKSPQSVLALSSELVTKQALSAAEQGKIAQAPAVIAAIKLPRFDSEKGRGGLTNTAPPQTLDFCLRRCWLDI